MRRGVQREAGYKEKKAGSAAVGHRLERSRSDWFLSRKRRSRPTNAIYRSMPSERSAATGCCGKYPWPWCDGARRGSGRPYPRGKSQVQWHWKSGIARMRKRAPICVASYGGETDRASPRSVWTRSAAAHQRCFHNWPLASFAPSTSALNLAQTIEGCTSFDPANEAKPQSALAMTRSRPTTPAKRTRR